MSKSNESSFSSRWGLLLSVLGIAVGTGNIWRFPRIAAQSGGESGAAAFLVAWLVFLFLWSIPLIVAEYAIGRRTRYAPVGAFVKIAGPKYAWMGAFVAFVATAIMFYYSVVAGWCMHYLFETVVNPLPFSEEAAQGVWDNFQSGGTPLIYHALAMGLGAIVCWRGIRSIERANKILVPALLVVVVIAVGRALTLPGAGEGIAYLFTPEWSQLADPNIWLQALTQNAWDTGAGWGLILAYAVYMQKDQGTVQNAFITGIGNNLVSLLAAIMIFGTVFSVLGAEMSREEILGVMQTSGPSSTGLTFIWMPQLFGQMEFGRGFAIMFFLGLTFAAMSSLISMIQLSSQVLKDWNVRNSVAVGTIAGLGFVWGVPSALSADFLANQDFVWGVALMISGAFISFAVIRFGTEKFRTEAVNVAESDWRAGKGWSILIKYVVPIEAIVLLVWWLYLSASTYSPDQWFNPFDAYSVMTCFVQWAVAIVVFLMLNGWMVRNLKDDPTEAE